MGHVRVCHMRVRPLRACARVERQPAIERLNASGAGAVHVCVCACVSCVCIVCMCIACVCAFACVARASVLHRASERAARQASGRPEGAAE